MSPFFRWHFPLALSVNAYTYFCRCIFKKNLSIFPQGTERNHLIHQAFTSSQSNPNNSIPSLISLQPFFLINGHQHPDFLLSPWSHCSLQKPIILPTSMSLGGGSKATQAQGEPASRLYINGTRDQDGTAACCATVLPFKVHSVSSAKIMWVYNHKLPVPKK